VQAKSIAGLLSVMVAIWGVGALWVCHGSACAPGSWDGRILHWFAGIRTAALDGLLSALTWMGSLAVLVPLAAVAVIWLLVVRRRHEAILVGAALVGISAITHALKLTIARPRPAWHEAVIAMPVDFSFPSAHAAQITAFVMALSLVLNRLTVRRMTLICAFGTLLVLVVCVSRLYLQVHFPSDVLAGCLTAMLWVTALAHLLPARHDIAKPCWGLHEK
jgi:membrane-associated phospholipid phosphatase